MIYSDIVKSGMILPKKAKYTIKDVNTVMNNSLFKPINGKTLTPKEAAFIVKSSAIYHDTDYSAEVANAGKKLPAPRAKKNPTKSVMKNPSPRKFNERGNVKYSVTYEQNSTGNIREFTSLSAAEKFIASLNNSDAMVYNLKLMKEIGDKPKKNPIIPGITARPVTGKRKPVFAVEYSTNKTGPWNTAGLFPNRTLSDDYCKSMHAGNSGKWWRVVLK